MTEKLTRIDQDPGPATDQAEARMREALGLTAPRPQREHQPQPAAGFAPASRPAGDAAKRRFVRDGEVQVMRMSSGAPAGRQNDGGQQRRQPLAAFGQVEAAQNALRNERAAREKLERQARELQAHVADLTTKLGHLALARDEAVETARRAEASRLVLEQELETVKAQLSAEVSARARAERAIARAEPPAAEQAPAAPARKPAAPPARRRKAKEAVEPEKEPEPIKWWLPKRAPRGKAKG